MYGVPALSVSPAWASTAMAMARPNVLMDAPSFLHQHHIIIIFFFVSRVAIYSLHP